MVDRPRPPDEPNENSPWPRSWGPVEFGSADPDDALAEIDSEAGADRDAGSADPAEYDAEVFERLPEWKRGDKARAYFVDADGIEYEFASGRRAESKEILGAVVPRFGEYVIADHIESHVAGTMRKEHQETGTLYINKVPCSGPRGCDEMLAWLLPIDARLTVYGPNGFIGEYRGDDR